MGLLLGMKQYIQLLFGFESKQKIDLLNSISFIFLGHFHEQTEKLTSEKFRDKLDYAFASWFISNLWGKAMIGYACPSADGRTDQIQMCLSRDSLTHQTAPLPKGNPGSVPTA